MRRNKFIALVVSALKEGKGVELKTGQCGEFYNVIMIWGDKYAFVTDEEYSYNIIVAEDRLRRYQKLINCIRA